MGKQKSYLDRYADTEYALTFLAEGRDHGLGRRPAGRRRGPQDRRSRPHRPHGRRQDLHPAGPAVRSGDRHLAATVDRISRISAGRRELASDTSSCRSCDPGNLIAPCSAFSCDLASPACCSSACLLGRRNRVRANRSARSTKPAPQSAGIRKLTSKHLVLYTDVPSSPEVDRLPADLRSGRAAVGRVLRRRSGKDRATGKPRAFSSATAAGSRRSA